MKGFINDKEFARYINVHRQIVGMTSDEAIAAIKDMGEDPMKWTREQHEIAATLFECYLREGRTLNEKLKNIFSQIADWFHRIYKALRGEGLMNDELVKAFDDILAGDLKQELETKEEQRTQQNQNANKKATDTLNQTSVNSKSREETIAYYSYKSRYPKSNIFDRVYVDQKRITETLKSDQEGSNYKREVVAAIKLANFLDSDVFLLPPNENGSVLYIDKHSNPDAITNGVFIDIKHNATDNKNSIKTLFSKAIKQADAVYLNLDGDMTITEAKRVVDGKINAMSDSHEGFGVIISDRKGNFGMYAIKQKRLEPSLSLGATGFYPSYTSKVTSENEAVKTLNQTLYQEEPVDLTEEFELIGIKAITSEDIENYIKDLIGKVFETASQPLKVQVVNNKVSHIVKSNVRLKGTAATKHNVALFKLDKIINGAKKFDKDGTVDTSHNSAKTARKKNNIEQYVYFHTPVAIGEKNFIVEHATEQIKGQDSNLLDLHNVNVKNSPAATNEIALQSGTGNTLTSGNETVKALNQTNRDDNSILYQTSKQLDENFPGWNDNHTKKTGGDKTQITSTVNSYEKIGTFLKDNVPEWKELSILDASSGLGKGTEKLREMGFDIDDVEPYPDGKRTTPPTYTDYSAIDKKYDIIIFIKDIRGCIFLLDYYLSRNVRNLNSKIVIQTISPFPNECNSYTRHYDKKKVGLTRQILHFRWKFLIIFRKRALECNFYEKLTLNYTINPDIKTITINQVATVLTVDIARDAVLELAHQNEGWNIEWNPETDAQISMHTRTGIVNFLTLSYFLSFCR